jgi:internalin A
LNSCTGLEKLFLSGNKIEAIANLNNLNKLTTLDLHKNKINTIKAVERLTDLETLDLSNNNLSQLGGLDNNINLQKITLNNNQLTTLKGISHLTHLKYLSASYNTISDCTELENMLQLQSIILDFNGINDITALLPHIKKGLRVALLNQKISTGDIHLLGNPVNTPPIEIMNQGNEAIIAHFDEIEAVDSMEINEAKLLILGAGGVGKTTLATKLKDANGTIPASEDTTIGINISIEMLPVAVDGRDYGIHIWDFGGQDIYHSTHQFFLTKRSFYILVEDGREQKNVMNYWLHVQELLSENSPMLLLQNLKAGSRRDIDIPTLKNNFQNLKEYIEVNLKEPTQIPAVWNLIKSQIMLMPHFGERISKRWLGIRREIENYAITTDYIPLSTFRSICVKHAVSNTKRQDILLAYLNDLGVLLHFIDIPELRRFIVIKPQWVTDAVYKILDHTKQQKIQGCFNWEDLEKVWSVPQYENMFPQLLSLMQKFELSYELPDKPKTYIAPLLLPESRPADLTWDDTDNLQLNYQYDFMPEGILPRLVVRIHSLIKNQEQVWKRGAVFTWDDTDALVVDNTLMRKIEIKVKGKEVKGLISIIIKELDEINEGYYFTEKRAVRKMVPCICSTCKISTQPYFHRYEILQRWTNELKRDKKACDNSGEEVSIAEMLNNVFVQNTANNIVANAGTTNKVRSILLMLANPVGTQSITIYEEFKQIKQELALSTNRQNFLLIDVPEATLSDITRSFTQNPAIVHFCGHGEGEDGIIINDMLDGTKHYLTNNQLVALFETRKESIECAVFSACKSEVQAELLSRQGIYVVGTSDKIENRTSILFSTGFYQCVYAGDNFEKAFVSGKSLAMGENKFEAQKFVLYRNGRKVS